MKVIFKRDGDLLSQFDKINENDIPIRSRINELLPQIRSTPHQKMLIDNHIDANKGKIKGYLHLEDILGFCKTFKKLTKNLVFHLMLKTNDLQDIIYKSMADDINVTINKLYLSVPNLIPSVETQLMFTEATQKNYMISYDDFYPERRVIKDSLVQHEIGSSQQNNSPKYLICTHQTKERISSPNKNKNNAIFDHLNLLKYYVEIDSIRYPRDSLLEIYAENDYIEQCKSLKLIFKEYIGEPLLNPFISYLDMETKYHIGTNNLRHQPDHITPKTI